MEFQKRFYRHRGITIIQKRDPGLSRIRPGKIALVLAGGAVSGGGFKAGGLRALDETFASRRLPGGKATSFALTDCDIFVGLSAGSILASVLAAGVAPAEILRILMGESDTYEAFRASEFMSPNLSEVAERAISFLAREQDLVTNYLSGSTDPQALGRYTLRKTLLKMIASLPSAIPTGLFTTDRLGEYLRRNMEASGHIDDFAAAHARTGKELFMTAVDINRGEMLVFGHDEPYRKVPISQAVSASCALPGWYRPARIANPRAGEPGEPRFLDLVDGGLVRTANVRLAVEKGADLVICYNPFNRIRYEREGRSLVDHGPYALFSQIFRVLLGARLDIAKELIYRDETVNADVVFVEPAEDDYVFFRMNPLRYGNRDRAAEHGYRSIRAAIESNHQRLAEVFATHGIALTAPAAQSGPWRGTELRAGDLTESRGALGRR